MKKSLLILTAILIVFSLFSCKVSKKDDQTDGKPSGEINNESGGGDTTVTDNTTFSENAIPTIVFNKDNTSPELIDGFANELSDIVGNFPFIKNDKSEIGTKEIIIGITDRPISVTAYEKLERVRREEDTDIAFVIYSDGNSIAIAYEEDKYGFNATANTAFSFILDTAKANGNTFTAKAGVIKAEIVDPIAYQESIDEELTEKRWQAVADAIGGEEGKAVANALKDLYQNYTDDAIDWFANLYDPAIGGFYYSNSGRDTEGYLPDAESTVQALNFIDASGLSYDLGGKYENVLPEWMKKQIISFAKGLQDPETGYFYHPQWGKDYTDTMISRRGRDLNWCCGILSRLGSAPTYDAPNGAKGDGILPDGTLLSDAHLASRLGQGANAVTAVSKVIPCADVAYYLRDKASLDAYLESLGDFGKNSYKYGDELATISPEFKARDKELIAAGKKPFAVETVVKYLNDRQNPVTGLWTYGSEVTYEGTNGLLKISAAYNTLEAEIPYPIEAATSAIASILTDEIPDTICFAYNSWYSVTNILKNLKYYSTASDKEAKREEVISATRSIAIEGIRATAQKLAIFRKDDGSFSYLAGSTASESHGMPVAIPGTNEGDVNATEIAIGGTSGHIFNALGISALKVPIYTKSDRARYIDLLESLGPVEKHEEDKEVTIYDFEDETVGYAPSDVMVNKNSSGEITVTKDYNAINGNKGRYLEMSSKSDGGDAVVINCDSIRSNAGCYIFEADFYFDTPTAGGNVIQITLGNKAYMLVMKVEKGNLTLMDVSAGTTPRITNDLCKLPMQEWFHLKVEYYPNSEEKVRTKIYLDGEFVAVTDNYYDSTKTKLNGREGKPSKAYITAEIYVMSYSEATLLVDNISSYKTNDIYKVPTAEEAAKLNVNADAVVEGPSDTAPGAGAYYNNKDLTENAQRFHYNIMGYPMPELSGGAYASVKAEDGSLVFTKTGSGESFVQFKYAVTDAMMSFANYCSIFEFDYKVTDTDLSYDNAPFRLDDANYIRFVKNSDGVSYSLGNKDTAEILPNKWFNIRFETYYIDSYTEYTKIYIDGEYSTTVRSSSMSPFNSRVCVYMKKAVDAGNVIKMDNVLYAHVDKEYVDESGNGNDSIDVNVGTAPQDGEYFNSDITANASRQDYSGTALPSISGSAGLVCNEGGSVVFIKTGDGEVYLNYALAKPSAAGDSPCSVFELDFKFDSEDPTGNYGMLFRFDDNDIIYFKKNSDGETYSIHERDTASINAGEWFNVRFEIYNTDSGKIAKIFVNGVYASEAALNNTSNYNSRLLIYMKSAVPKNDVIYIDNVFIGHIEKSYE